VSVIEVIDFFPLMDDLFQLNPLALEVAEHSITPLCVSISEVALCLKGGLLLI
jgi:hypothetical protein